MTSSKESLKSHFVPEKRNVFSDLKMDQRESALTGTPDTDILILLESDYPSVIAACQANPYLYSLCRDPNFWTNKLVKDFGSRFTGFITPTRSAQRVYDKLYLISREFGPEVLQYISPADSFDDLYSTLDQMSAEFDPKILRFKSPDQNLQEYLQSLMNPDNRTSEGNRIAYILRFNNLMDQVLSDDGHERVLNVSQFNPQNISLAFLVLAPKSPRSAAIRPRVTVDGNDILVPIVAQPGGLNGFQGFLNEVVAYSAYSDLVPEILRSFMEELQRRSDLSGMNS